jgi:multiple sugar transport system substrate-binding protein
MRGKVSLPVLAAALALAACGGGSNGSSSKATTAAGGATVSHTPVTLVMWHMFGNAEKAILDKSLLEFKRQYPWITIKEVVQPNTDNDTFDPNLVNAINGGNAPDVAMPFSPEYVGQYCSAGLWLDLAPYMKRDHMAISDFSPAAISETNYGGKQCALPSLTDAFGLYYNTDMFAKAGITSPPKTMEELMADAEKLTVKNPDGTIKVAGFVPLNQWEQLGPSDLAAAAGGKWFDANNQPQISRDPAWAQGLNWQKQLIDFYGYDAITKFYAAYHDAEWGPENAFETGKVAMMLDGEWRTAFIARDGTGVNYDTAPFPVFAGHEDLYGSGRVGGTIVGIPKGTKHPDDAWLLVKFLASDTTYLVNMANHLGNVPTTKASAGSPYLIQPPQFQTFVNVWNNPKSASSPPLQPSGSGYANLFDTFEDKWQAGKITDLQPALVKLDQDIANQLAQGQVP